MQVSAIAIVLAIGIGLAGPVGADDHGPLRAAEQELKIARDHLNQAGREYGGRRRAAIEHVNKALDDIRLALKGTKSGDTAPTDSPPAAAPTEDD